MSQDILEIPAPPADFRIQYGSDRFQFGDLRLPAEEGPHPVAVVIHGGFWRSRYDLSAIGHVAAALRDAGVATWNIEYRRLGNPGGGWPGTFGDVSRATDFVTSLASSQPLDLERVITIGHSAGGHLALWAASQERSRFASSDLRPVSVRGAVSLAGVTDLREAWRLRLSSGVVGQLVGGAPEEVPDRYAAASPAERLPLGVPQILLHGMRDESVPYMLSERYAEAAKAAGDTVQLISFPEAGHFEVIDPRWSRWPVVRDAVLRLLEPGASPTSP